MRGTCPMTLRGIETASSITRVEHVLSVRAALALKYIVQNMLCIKKNTMMITQPEHQAHSSGKREVL